MADNYDLGNDAWRAQVHENSARHVQVYKFYNTTGTGGGILFDEPVDFGVIFTEQPAVSYGFALDESVAQDLADGDYPTSSGGVFEWSTTVRGLYVGATVFVVVGSQLLLTSYSLTHTFTFSGIGVKDVGEGDFQA